MIRVQQPAKLYGNIQAVAGLDLQISRGGISGLLRWTANILSYPAGFGCIFRSSIGLGYSSGKKYDDEKLFR